VGAHSRPGLTDYAAGLLDGPRTVWREALEVVGDLGRDDFMAVLTLAEGGALLLMGAWCFGEGLAWSGLGFHIGGMWLTLGAGRYLEAAALARRRARHRRQVHGERNSRREPCDAESSS
jgi:hypothetical protein